MGHKHFKTVVREERIDRGWALFKNRCLVRFDLARTPERDVWLVYRAAMAEADAAGTPVDTVGRREFTRRLLAEGFERSRSGGRVLWDRLGLSPEGKRLAIEGRSLGAADADAREEEDRQRQREKWIAGLIEPAQDERVDAAPIKAAWADRWGPLDSDAARDAFRMTVLTIATGATKDDDGTVWLHNCRAREF